MTELPSLRQQIVAAMHYGEALRSDDAFNALALRVFRFQFENNLPYRKFCERRIPGPDAVRHWIDVPAVPTAAFKAAPLLAGDLQHAQAVFRTSGTTLGAASRGAHYVLDLDLYEQSLLPTFVRYVLPDDAAMPIASLIAPWEAGGESSLSYMISTIMRELGSSNYFAVSAAGIDHQGLHNWLDERITRGEQLCLVGTSLAFVHWFDFLRATGSSFQLPIGSRVMDTGGFKGSARSTTSAELREQYTRLLDIPPHYVVNEYGMTEMLSQFYDIGLSEAEQLGVKRGPDWVRYAIVDPETLVPLPAGQTGLLRHFDLANLFSVSAIQTEDIGRASEAGFELFGRAAGAMPRGCSIAMDVFLSASRS